MTLTLDILDRLVAFDTVSANPNSAIIGFIENFLHTRGTRCTRLPAPQSGKCGLLAELGPRTGGGIVLSGHTDVVPVAGQNWTRPPFSLTREGTRLYGRGTTDMKGFLAAMLSAADAAARQPLQEPLKLVFSYDEEIGCVGIGEMSGRLRDLIGTPRACIVGEPTQMQVATGHKGKVSLQADCSGQAGHSALAPQYVNALHIAVDFVAGLRDIQQELAQNGATDRAYDIPYSTVHVGKLSGGTALNIVPDRAQIAFEFRHLTADPPADIMAKIDALAARLNAPYGAAPRLSVRQINAYPGLNVAPDSAAAQLAKAALNTDQTSCVAFGTEAGFFEAMGISTVVCGPGSMAGQGHKADEFIERSALDACDKMLANLISTLT
ncbi:MAG: acetylornithine deacetylase [Sulfitobacter sp.]